MTTAVIIGATFAATTVIVAPVAYLFGRNQQRLMVDIDKLGAPYRTCPEPDDYTKARRIFEREGLA